jgi:Tfp pilus assembly protein PilF/TolB-like protein
MKFRPSSGRIALLLPVVAILTFCTCGKKDTPETEPAGESSPIATVAVLPFQNQDPHPETHWIGAGIAQLLNVQLSPYDQLKVVRHSRIETILRIMNVKKDSVLSKAVLLNAAKGVEATRAVFGDYRVDNGQLLIQARLVNVTNGAVVTEESTRGAGVQSIFRLTDQIATSLSDQLGVAITSPIDDIELTTDLEAYQFFIEGRKAFCRFDTPDGMAHLLKSVARDAGFALAYATMAIQAFSIGDLSRASWAVGHSLSYPDRLPAPERILLEAIGDQLSGKYEQSFETYQRLEETVRPDPETSLVLAQMFCSIRDYSSAEKIYENVLRQDPNNVVAHIMLGLTLLELDLQDLAQARVEEALRLKPDHPHAYIVMSQIYAHQGKLEDAEQQLRRASDLNPKDPWIHNQLGYFYLSRNKPELALEEFKRYAELAPDDPNAHDSLAEGYLRTGNEEMAEKEYLRALALKPDFDNPHFMLGEIYHSRGERQKAIRMYQKYLQINPHGPRAKAAEQNLEVLAEE